MQLTRQFLTIFLLCLSSESTLIDQFSPHSRQKRQNPGSCEFGSEGDLSTCSWIRSNTSQLEWQLGSGMTAFLLGGPKSDRSGGGSNTGGYVFMDTSATTSPPPLSPKRTGYLESPLRGKTEADGTCLQFWYNINGLSAEGLRVLLIPSNPLMTGTANEIFLWEARDSTDVIGDSEDTAEPKGWQKGEILFTFGYPHIIAFEAIAKPTSDPASLYRGHVAIDDVEMATLGHSTPRACSGFCSFEGKLCNWNNQGDDDFDWQQGRGSLSRLTGPARDHSSFVNGGGYIYIDTSYPRRPGDKARLISPIITPRKADAPTCFRFYTHMYGSGVGSLEVKVLESGKDERTVWKVNGDAGNQWHKAQVTVASSSLFQMILEATVGKNPMGNIAVDDIVFLPGACPAAPPSAVSREADCTFEDEECKWYNIITPIRDQTDWQRISPVQMTTGVQPNVPILVRRMEPTVDHTKGEDSGFFLSLERGGPSSNGDRALFFSPEFKESDTACLSFWASLHERSSSSEGPGLGTIRVYVRPKTSSLLGPVGLPVWRLINHESPSWFNAQMPVKYKDGPFHVIIEGTWGSTRQGSMAIDDITVYDNKNCKAIPSVASVALGECSFDKDLCDWRVNNNNVTSTHNQWQLASSLRHPQAVIDHTYQSNTGYVYFDVYSPQIPISARLQSPELPPSSNAVCFSFWFMPLGSGSETTLRVLVGSVENGQIVEESQVWSVQTSEVVLKIPDWIYGQASFMKDLPYKVTIEGLATNGGYAIDDFSFYTGSCPTRPHVAKKESSTSTQAASKETTTEVSTTTILNIASTNDGEDEEEK